LCRQALGRDARVERAAWACAASSPSTGQQFQGRGGCAGSQRRSGAPAANGQACRCAWATGALAWVCSCGGCTATVPTAPPGPPGPAPPAASAEPTDGARRRHRWRAGLRIVRSASWRLLP
jgi:hypothetical protein